MTSNEKIAPFHGILAEPYAAAKEWKNTTHGKVIGHLMPDVPEELIHASGAFPLSILTKQISAYPTYVPLPGFTCSVINAPMVNAINGALDFIDGMVIPYVCDSTRAFSQVWELNFREVFNFFLWLPKKPHGKGSREFLYEEFVRMKHAIEVLLQKDIEKSAINRSIEIYNKNRGLLRRLRDLKKDGVNLLTNSDYFACIGSSMLVPREEHSQLLLELLTELEFPDCKDVRNSVSPRIFLFGAVCDNPDIFACMDEAGLQVVDDNLYNATRDFSADAPSRDDPIQALVERQVSKHPLSCFHYQKNEMTEHLSSRIRNENIDGVLFLSPQNCEPLGFDYPAIRELTAEMNVPLLFLETDLTSGSLAQIRNRLQAFSEILTDRKHGNI